MKIQQLNRPFPIHSSKNQAFVQDKKCEKISNSQVLFFPLPTEYWISAESMIQSNGFPGKNAG